MYVSYWILTAWRPRNVNMLPIKSKQATFPSIDTEEELPYIFSNFFQSKLSAIRYNLDLAF